MRCPLLHYHGKSHATDGKAKDTAMVSRDRQLSFLLDVDNTLLENVALKERLAARPLAQKAPRFSGRCMRTCDTSAMLSTCR